MGILGLFAAGGAAGLVGSLLGVGGGLVVVPVLHLLFGVPLRTAVGTSLVVITGTSLVGTAGYLRRGWTMFDLALRLELGALIGAVAASRLAPRVPEHTVAWIFALVLTATALQLAIRSGRRPGEERPTESRLRRGLAWGLAPLGGGASGLLGIGGGLVQVPILRLALGLEMRRAVATSTATVGWTASLAALAYLGRGEVDLAAAPWLLAGILAGGGLGPVLAGRIPRRGLELLFAVLLLWTAWKVVQG
ncbi:MAG: sulfite exporter TauE/SafE family protein [Thermoanaerobaculia bacterium]